REVSLEAGHAGSLDQMDVGTATGDLIRGARVLLVEDDDLDRELAARLLATNGVRVVAAFDGREALAILQGDKGFDAVLMDIQMPVMDGYTATRAIRAQPGFADLPIIALTANAMAGDLEQAMAAGMNDHIGKPFDLDSMSSTLGKWIHPKWNSPTGPRGIVADLEDAARRPLTAPLLPPRLAGVDVASGLALALGDQQLYRKLLDLFRAQYLGFH
ncbi:MAG: response regulator, partial [Gammaproteobacteria bacterium]